MWVTSGTVAWDESCTHTLGCLLPHFYKQPCSWHWLASGYSGPHPDWESWSAGCLAQAAVIQVLVVADTLTCPGALSLLPSVWLYSWAWDPTLHTWEGVWLPLEPLGAHWGKWPPPLGLGDVSCQLSKSSSSMASRTSSSMNTIRLVMHSQRSLAVQHITWYGPLDCWAQLDRALARARVCSLLVFQISWEPLRSPGGRNVVQCRPQRLGGGSHQLFFSNWAVWSWKPAACLLGVLLYDLSQASLVWSEELRTSVVWCPLPLNICPHQLSGTFDWVWHCAVCEWVLHSCRPSRWGSGGPGRSFYGSCRVLLVILPHWHGHLGSYQRASGHWHRQSLSITSLIGGTFRPFEEASQVSW